VTPRRPVARVSLPRGQIFLPVRGRFDFATLIARGGHAPWRSGGRTRPWLERPERLPDGSVRLLRICAEAGGIVLQVTGRAARDIETLAPLAVRVRRALGLDARHPGAGAPRSRASPRVLRGTTAFEDLVGILVARDRGASPAVESLHALVSLGSRCPADRRRHAFPTPEVLARLPLRELRRRTGLGPAAGWVRTLARDVARGTRDPRELDDLTARDAVRALRGVEGLDAAGVRTMLRLLGHTDGSAARSVVRRASTRATRTRRAARS